MKGAQPTVDFEQREFRADPLKLKRLRVTAGLTVQDFAKKANLDRTTAAKILRGDPVFLKSLAIAGRQAFGIESPLELLHPDELRGLGVPLEVPSPSQVLEWDIAEYLSGWHTTSNGLQYQRLRLCHRYLRNRLALAKCYELRHLSHAARDRLEGHLRRHVEVCERVGPHPNVAQNLTAAWIGGLWWVLDRWEEGGTLSQRLEDGPLTEHGLKLVMTGIAQGLKALHASGIIRRELSTSCVLLRERTDQPVLCDLELAKLGEGGRTVAPEDWPDDPYRAIEVGGDAPIDERADIYSWGRIFVHAATGELLERGKERLSAEIVPDDIWQLVLRCVAEPRSARPAKMTEVLSALKAW